MLYFLQTAVHEDKHLNKGLLNIYGVGKHIAKISVLQYGLLDEAKGKDLRRLHRLQLKSHFDDYPLELASDLKEIYKNNCQRLIDIQSYKGRRHKGRYPVRGQRTHTNAKTQKRLYKRWLINTYEKAKPLVNQKKTSNTVKPKKSKVSKPKPSNKTKAKAPKASKYKI